MISKADAVTAEDWRRIAEHMEYSWICCSEGFNKRVGELQAQLTAANERIRELEDTADEYKQLHGFAVNGFNRVAGELTAEREVSNKLEKALIAQPRKMLIRWKDGIDIEVPDYATEMRDTALAEVAAIRTLPQSTGEQT